MQVGAWALWSTVAAVLVEAGMGTYFWRRRDRFRGGTWFTGAIATAMVGAACFLGQLFAPTDAGAVFWSQLVGVAGLGSLVTVFGFAATYTHRAWVLRSRWFVLLGTGLVAAFVARMTNSLPGWPGVHTLWATDAMAVVRGGVRLVAVDRGPLWFVYMATVAAWLVVASALLVEFSLRPSQRLYRRRNAVVTVGIATPALAAIAAETVAAGFEVTVPGVALSLLLVGAALARFGALEAVPIARTGVVDEIEGGVVVFDDRRQVVDVTTRARDILDAPSAEPGDDLPSLLAGRLDGFDPSGDVAAQLDGETFEVDAGAERRAVETRVSTLTDRSGARLSRALLIYDVTDRVARERELRRKNEFLDEFASVVSHDIATPLGVVENKARLVELTGDPAHVTDIYEATERVQALVEELRVLARQGRDVGETRPVALEPLARDVWRSVDTGGATLHVESSTTLDANRQLLRQVLENLLENAVEHGGGRPSNGVDDSDPASAVERGVPDVHRSSTTVEAARGDDGPPAAGAGSHGTPPDGEPTADLTVRVGALDDGFFVADEGPGVPDADRDRVFEQGFTTDDGGTGLGLAIVRLVVDAHGWSVRFTESEAGGGRVEVTDATTADGSED